MNRKMIKVVLILLGTLLAVMLATVRFNVTGNYEGIYLLEGKAGYLFELKDDLFMNEERRYIGGVDLGHAIRSLKHPFKADALQEPYLSYAWNERAGDGYIRNHFGGGKQLLTYLSRFVDDGGKEVFGLFVGGGLPEHVRGRIKHAKNETGMAFFDGARWHHLWCNTNEALFSSRSFVPLYPSSWKFLGSRVLHNAKDDLILESTHEVAIDGVPLRIDRYAQFRAGETYFVLSQYITNIGDRPATYSYLYGDEPWLGEYGSSDGNVGWSADGLHKYVGELDTSRVHYAGFFDYGNDAAGEKHIYSGIADFIEWFGERRPRAYFTNGPFEGPQVRGKRLPLAGNARFIGILWGMQTLAPDQTAAYTMAIGMADRDAKTGFPLKPAVDLKNFP